MNNYELMNVIGGGISASLLNSFSRFISSVYEVGQSLGTSIRMMISRKRC